MNRQQLEAKVNGTKGANGKPGIPAIPDFAENRLERLRGMVTDTLDGMEKKAAKHALLTDLSALVTEIGVLEELVTEPSHQQASLSSAS